jgi:Flp pilus assembly protein TadD
LADHYQDKTVERKQQARSRAETAMRLAPESIDAALALAHYDARIRGDRDAARARLEGLAQRASADPRVLEALAQLEFRSGRLEAGDRWLARATALPGGSAWLWSSARVIMA